MYLCIKNQKGYKKTNNPHPTQHTHTHANTCTQSTPTQLGRTEEPAWKSHFSFMGNTESNKKEISVALHTCY
jgi:hypothetical protein